MLAIKIILAAAYAAGVVVAQDWNVGFYNDNCYDSVSPGGISGSGPQGCALVSGADCMNGRVISGITPGTMLICGYSGSNCDGDNTSLSGAASSGHAIIYNGGVENINSYQVIASGSC